MTQQVTYISTSEVARIFGVGRSAVSRWVSTGKLRPTLTTPGGHHKFTQKDVDQLLEASSNETSPALADESAPLNPGAVGSPSTAAPASPGAAAPSPAAAAPASP